MSLNHNRESKVHCLKKQSWKSCNQGTFLSWFVTKPQDIGNSQVVVVLNGSIKLETYSNSDCMKITVGTTQICCFGSKTETSLAWSALLSNNVSSVTHGRIEWCTQNDAFFQQTPGHINIPRLETQIQLHTYSSCHKSVHVHLPR